MLFLPPTAPLQLFQLHQSLLLQPSLGWPYPFQNIEIYATQTQSSLAQEMSTIRSQQEQILTTQTQHTAIDYYSKSAL